MTNENTDGTIIEFLLGEKSFNGYWYGDLQVGKVPFWWRKHLREFMQQSSPSSSAGVWVIIPTDLTIKQKAEEYERSYKSTGQPGTCTAFAAGADFVRSLITPQKQ